MTAQRVFLLAYLSLTTANRANAQSPLPAPIEPKVVETREIVGALDGAKWTTTGPVRFAASLVDAPGMRSKALRAEVSLTHEAYKQRSFAGEIFAWPSPQDWSNYNRLVLWVFVEPSQTMRGGSLSVHLYNSTDNIRRTLGVYVAPRGKWTPVTFDITPVPRDCIVKLMITQGVHRHNPGEADRMVYHFGRMELQRVEPPTKFCGWELQPHRVAFSHVGYLPSGEKTAIFHEGVGETARLLDAATGKTVWQGKLKSVSHERTGRFKVADFSDYREPGRYVLAADGPSGPVPTEPFDIKPEAYQDAIRRVFDFYRAERCGDAAPGYHATCHLDDGWVKPYEDASVERFAPEVRALFGKHVDCSGGWHDAGDQAKFAYQEYNSAVQMFRLYERGLRYARPGAERDAVLDEAIWGARYALKTLLPTGRSCDRPERVGLGVWTDNVPGNGDDRIVGMTTWNCVERYIAGMMAEAIAARLLHDIAPALAGQCLAQAKLEAEAYLTGAMKDWRSGNWLPLKYGAVGLAFLELYRATGDERYAKEAIRCGDELIACQEQGLAWNNMGITGFWYDGPQRRHPFAEASGDAKFAYLLAELCRQFPDASSWMKWYAALRIYARFYAQAGSPLLAPYGVPPFSLRGGADAPYHYYDYVTPLDQSKSVKLDFQFDKLVRVGPFYVVRIRSTTSALNTSAMTLAAIADVARDPQAEAMAHRCLQWMAGRNPFSRSQVWEVGHRFREQPHYAATHDEMPGSVPAKGIDGRLDGDALYHDEPYSDPLPRCVINEVCIAQSQYLLNAGRELAFSPTVKGVVRKDR